MTGNKIWNIQHLKELENKLKLNLSQKQDFDEKTIGVYSRICGVCSLSFCHEEWNKSFRCLERTCNPYCSKHAKQMLSIKKHDEYIEKLENIMNYLKKMILLNMVQKLIQS